MCDLVKNILILLDVVVVHCLCRKTNGSGSVVKSLGHRVNNKSTKQESVYETTTVLWIMTERQFDLL